MPAGTYVFQNKDFELTLALTDDGWQISSATLNKNDGTFFRSGKGELKIAERSMWYEFTTKDCNYDLDVPKGKTLILNQTSYSPYVEAVDGAEEEFEFDFDVDLDELDQILNEVSAQIKWEGRFSNGYGGLLTISSVSKTGFTYELVYKSNNDCNGLNYRGTAYFKSNSEASNETNDGTMNFMDIETFELKGETIILYPAASMVGMECQSMFKETFKRK